MKKLILITFYVIIISKPLISQTPVCYDASVYSWFYNLIPQVDNTQYSFAVPIAFQSTENEDRIFIQPGWLEKHNLWNVDQRQKNYEKAFMDLALFADYEAEKKRAVQRYFLEKAPYLIKNSILYSSLKNYYEHDVDVSKSLQEIKLAYTPLEDPRKIIKGINLILETTTPLTYVPTEISQFYPGMDPQVILNQTNFNAAATWLKGFKILGNILSATNAWINIDQASQDILSHVLFSQVLANEAAKERIQDIKAGLIEDGLYSKDIAIQNAIRNVEIFLEQGSSQQFKTTLINSIGENSGELISGTLTIAKILLSDYVTSVMLIVN